MHTQIQVNRWAVQSITAEANPHSADLISLGIVEQGDGGHTIQADLTMDRTLWQRVADQLALLGITPTVHGVEAYACGRCGARFGIAGHSTGSPEDLAAEEQYRADVEYHEAGWIAFMIAEGAYHDLRVERDGYRARARAAETKLGWRTGVDL